jgi:UDP-2,3-diacylglucosamine hydrolase
MILPQHHVAILAGGGDLPLQIAASVVGRGGRVHVVAIAGEADVRVAAYPHTWVNLGQASRMFAALKPPKGESGVMVIAGAVTRPDILKLRPDFGIVRVLAQVLGLITAGGDDALLTRAIRIFEREGLTVVGVQDVAPEVMVGAGALGARVADAAAVADIAIAEALLADLGAFDIGQAAVVADGRMLARLSSAEDGRRVGVLLKAPKPRQERRVDLPTIGRHTIERAAAAGLAGIAVRTGGAIILQRAQMIAAADAAGMFVAGVAAPDQVPVGPANAPDGISQSKNERHRLSSRDMADAIRAMQVARTAARYIPDTAAVVVRGHVLAVAASEGIPAAFERACGLGQWGLSRIGWRRGVAAMHLNNDLTSLTSDETTTCHDVVARAGWSGTVWEDAAIQLPSYSSVRRPRR